MRTTMIIAMIVVLAACGDSASEGNGADPTPRVQQPVTQPVADILPTALFMPTTFEELLPSRSMLDGDYSLQSSNYMSHDRVESLDGFVDSVALTFSFDINSVPNPEEFMLSFGALCFEFETAANATPGFDEVVSITEDTSEADVEDAEINPLPVRYRALEGSVRIQTETENADHIIIQADRFVCQYTGIGLRGYHKPLDDVREVVEKILAAQ